MLPSHRIAKHPGVVLLEEFLQPTGTSQASLADSLNVPLNRVNEIVKGKRGVSAETALLLSGYFQNSPEFWMNLQMVHDLSKARKSFKPVAVEKTRRKKAIA